MYIFKFFLERAGGLFTRSTADFMLQARTFDAAIRLAQSKMRREKKKYGSWKGYRVTAVQEMGSLDN